MERNEVFTAVGAKVRQLRDERHMMQTDLAKASGIEKANLSRIERGKTNCTIWTLARIAQALQIPVSVLVDGIQPVKDEDI